MVLKMSGSIPLLPLYSVIGRIGTLLSFTFIVYYRPTKKKIKDFHGEKKGAVYSENRK
jgi:hypothetical protein